MASPSAPIEPRATATGDSTGAAASGPASLKHRRRAGGREVPGAVEHTSSASPRWVPLFNLTGPFNAPAGRDLKLLTPAAPCMTSAGRSTTEHPAEGARMHLEDRDLPLTATDAPCGIPPRCTTPRRRSRRWEDHVLSRGDATADARRLALLRAAERWTAGLQSPRRSSRWSE